MNEWMNNMILTELSINNIKEQQSKFVQDEVRDYISKMKI